VAADEPDHFFDWRSSSAPKKCAAAFKMGGSQLRVLPLGLTLTIYTAEPGSASDEALRLLASWAASENPATDATLTSD
jgi:hypothetical protein